MDEETPGCILKEFNCHLLSVLTNFEMTPTNNTNTKYMYPPPGLYSVGTLYGCVCSSSLHT